MLAGFARARCAVMSHIRTDRDLIIVQYEIPDLCGRRVALLHGAEELFEDPLGLVNDAEVARVTGLAFLVSGRHDAHEAADAVEAPAPVVRGCVLGDVGRPRFGVEGPEPFGE